LATFQPWFWDFKYWKEEWANIYECMSPDDLHSVFGGVLGYHFRGILLR
jgi:hypothetical protein